MPIMPWAFCPETIEDFLSQDELNAIVALSDLCDPRKDSHFWESIVARITSGNLTDHRCGWDVELGDIRIEVKFATAFVCQFNNGARRVFKFASMTGAGDGRKPCDVMVMIGFDDPFIYAWVVPYGEITSNVSTISVPTQRYSPMGRSKIATFDQHASCASQLLPHILMASAFSSRVCEPVVTYREDARARQDKEFGQETLDV